MKKHFDKSHVYLRNVVIQSRKDRPVSILKLETDYRLNCSSVYALCACREDEVQGYYDGLLTLRADPGIRASFVYYNVDSQRPDITLFSYEQLIAIAWLVYGGWPRRAAAAAVHNKLVGCCETGTSCRDLRPDRDYTVSDHVRLRDETSWDILMAAGVTAHQPFLFREDFGVNAVDADGNSVDLEHDEFPDGVIFPERITHNALNNTLPLKAA